MFTVAKTDLGLGSLGKFKMLSIIVKWVCDYAVPESNVLILSAWKFCSFADQTWNPNKSSVTFDLQNCKILRHQKMCGVTFEYWIIVQSWLFIFYKSDLSILKFDTE